MTKRYDRHRYDAEKRIALDRWAAHLRRHRRAGAEQRRSIAGGAVSSQRSKGVVPAGAALSAQDDATFERIQTGELDRLAERLKGDVQSPPVDPGLAFWMWLPKAFPSTRRRLLVKCLKVYALSNKPPPEKLISLIEQELVTKGAPRARIRSPENMRSAATCLVRNPGSSLEKIAESIQAPGKKTTIAYYLDGDDFWKICAEEALKHDLSRQYDVLADYEKRFGRLDYNGTALCYLVPQMLAALEAKRPLAPSNVEGAERAYAQLIVRDSLEARLRPA